MKVKCLFTSLKDANQNGKGGKLIPDDEYNYILEIGKEYTVLSLKFLFNDYYNGVLIGLKDEGGVIREVPMWLLAITDPRPSSFWIGKADADSFLLKPEEFYKEYFHDLLTDGDPEYVKLFNQVAEKLEAEFKEPEDPYAWPFEEYK